MKPSLCVDQMRRSYQLKGLDETDLIGDPPGQFARWFEEAGAAETPPWLEINAMTLSTSSPELGVSSRIVLLKGVEEGKFLFFTNYRSVKAEQIAIDPQVALCFLWPHIERQVRIVGNAAKTSREKSVEYFRTRPRGSQLGALISDQSAKIDGRESLEMLLHGFQEQYSGQEIPCPEHWGGYAVTPSAMEFWQGRENRLHDRILYERAGDGWAISRLAP